MDTRVGHGLRSTDNRGIIVDTREFRSTLPAQLYRKGFRLAAEQLYCGDFVLSDKVVVEKKSKGDLSNSLPSGRLFQQCESMLKHYDRNVLLVQLEDRLSLHDAGSEMRSDALITRFAILLMRFPNLRVIWARGVEHAAELLAALKGLGGDPDIERACRVGSNDDLDKNLLNGMGGDADDINEAAVEMLLKVPGVNQTVQVTEPDGNKKMVRVFNIIMNNCDCFEELAGKDKKELKSWGLSIASVEKIYRFFNTPVKSVEGWAPGKQKKATGNHKKAGKSKGSKKRRML